MGDGQFRATIHAAHPLPRHQPPVVMATKSLTAHGNSLAAHLGATKITIPTTALTAPKMPVSARDAADSDTDGKYCRPSRPTADDSAGPGSARPPCLTSVVDPPTGAA